MSSVSNSILTETHWLRVVTEVLAIVLCPPQSKLFSNFIATSTSTEVHTFRDITLLSSAL